MVNANMNKSNLSPELLERMRRVSQQRKEDEIFNKMEQAVKYNYAEVSKSGGKKKKVTRKSKKSRKSKRSTRKSARKSTNVSRKRSRKSSNHSSRKRSSRSRK